MLETKTSLVDFRLYEVRGKYFIFTKEGGEREISRHEYLEMKESKKRLLLREQD